MLSVKILSTAVGISLYLYENYANPIPMVISTSKSPKHTGMNCSAKSPVHSICPKSLTLATGCRSHQIQTWIKSLSVAQHTCSSCIFYSSSVNQSRSLPSGGQNLLALYLQHHPSFADVPSVTVQHLFGTTCRYAVIHPIFPKFQPI